MQTVEDLRGRADGLSQLASALCAQFGAAPDQLAAPVIDPPPNAALPRQYSAHDYLAAARTLPPKFTAKELADQVGYSPAAAGSALHRLLGEKHLVKAGFGRWQVARLSGRSQPVKATAPTPAAAPALSPQAQTLAALHAQFDRPAAE